MHDSRFWIAQLTPTAHDPNRLHERISENGAWGHDHKIPHRRDHVVQQNVDIQSDKTSVTAMHVSRLWIAQLTPTPHDPNRLHERGRN